MFKQLKVFLLSLFILPCFMFVGCSEHEHKLTLVGSIDATCVTSGNTEYYTCECGKFFSDKEATEEIVENSWVVEAIGHTDANLDEMCDVCGHGQTIIMNGVNYTNLQDVFANSHIGAAITLHKDFNETSELADDKIIITKNTTVNFTNKTINLDLPNATSATANWVGINVEGGNVIFNGTTGGIKTADNAELYAVVVRNNANLTINGGSYIGGTTAVSVTAGTVTINGGFFAAQADDQTFTLNCVDAAYKNGTAKIVVKGGTFVNFNPADNEAESGGHTSFVPAGYTVVAETQSNGDVWYRVVPGNDFVVNGINYTTLEAALEHATNGSTITLYKNTLTDKTFVITKEVIFNLNGHNIIASNSINDIALLKVEGAGKLTINGNGVINGATQANNYGIAVWARNGGEVVINGGVYTNLNSKSMNNDDTYNNNELIYASGEGSLITINAGTFIGNYNNARFGAGFTLNQYDGHRTICDIVVKGGTYVNFNPENNAAENANTSFVAEGYSVEVEEQLGGMKFYTVVPGGTFAANGKNYPTLELALAKAINGSAVTLYADTLTDKTFVITKEVVLNLNGHNISASNSINDIALLKVEGAGKLTINGNGIINGATQANDYGIAVWARNGGEVVINGGTYTNLNSKAVDGQGVDNNNELIYASGEGSLITINAGTFIGNYNNEGYGAGFTLNQYDAHRTICDIVVKGGTYVSFNPADNAAEGTGTCFVDLEAYAVEESNDGTHTIYTVVAKA